MPVWGWVLSAFIALAGLFVLLLSLFHVRYRAAWRGEWGGLHEGANPLASDGFVRVEFGFPGFMRALDWKNPAPARARAAPPDAQPAGATARPSSAPREEPFTWRPAPGVHGMAGEGVTHAPHAPASMEENGAAQGPGTREAARKGAAGAGTRAKDPHRWRRALFRLATDAPAWGRLARYGLRVLRLAHRLLRPRLAMTAGHPDPALLGRMAGWWYAAAPLLPRGGPTLGFRFQDRRPSFGVRVEGGFSALSLLLFGAGAIATFPWIGLGRRAWHGWRHHRLTGWRAWTYRRLQSP
jgi:hypothetical protein